MAEQAGSHVRSFCTGMTATWLSPEKPQVLEFADGEYSVKMEQELLASQEHPLLLSALDDQLSGEGFVCK